MAIKTRGQIGMAGDIIQLRTEFRDPGTGLPVDPDVFPVISIQQPSGNVLFSWTNVGVYRIDTGIYGYDFTVDPNPVIGVWADEWRGSASGNLLYNSHNFVIHYTQMPMLNTDGYYHLGDEPGFDFSQIAVKNINKLVWILKNRLNSSGKALVKDDEGNEQLVDCDIYTIPQLVTFMIAGMSAFNMIPHFTEYTFDDSEFLNLFGEIVVRHALIYALASKALIERGREFQITDNGVAFQPPGVSDILNTQYGAEYTHWESDIKLIKQNMKPAPTGLGTLRPLAASPQFMRLRHLRAKRIF